MSHADLTIRVRRRGPFWCAQATGVTYAATTPAPSRFKLDPSRAYDLIERPIYVRFTRKAALAAAVRHWLRENRATGRDVGVRLDG